MRFPQLESIKSHHPSLSSPLDALAAYVAAEIDDGRTRIVPALAAAAITKSEAQTTALLMLFEDAGIVAHQFDIVCTRNNAVLLTLTDLSDWRTHLPVHCSLCDMEHGDDDLRIELVFAATSTPVLTQHAVA